MRRSFCRGCDENNISTIITTNYNNKCTTILPLSIITQIVDDNKVTNYNYQNNHANNNNNNHEDNNNHDNNNDHDNNNNHDNKNNHDIAKIRHGVLSPHRSAHVPPAYKSHTLSGCS